MICACNVACVVGGEVVVILPKAAKDEREEGEQLEQTGGPEGQGRREGRRHRSAVQEVLSTLRYRSNSRGTEDDRKWAARLTELLAGKRLEFSFSAPQVTVGGNYEGSVT